MSKVTAGITMSLDGYTTGPNDRPGHGLGEGGERLHYWVFGGPWTYQGEHRPGPTGVDQQFFDETMAQVGAVIGGRTWVGRTGGSVTIDLLARCERNRQPSSTRLSRSRAATTFHTMTRSCWRVPRRRSHAVGSCLPSRVGLRGIP